MKNCVVEDSIKKTLFYLLQMGRTQKTKKHSGRSLSFMQSSLGSFSKYSRQSDTIIQAIPFTLSILSLVTAK